MAFDLRFTKGHGTGNDFVFFSDPEGDTELTPTQIAAVCDRRFGVGADGVIRAVRSRNLDDGAAALAEDPAAVWFMDYWNADGTVSEMCGNGIRVFTSYLLDQGLAELPPGGTIAIGTRAGVRTVSRTATGFQADLGPWRRACRTSHPTAAGQAIELWLRMRQSGHRQARPGRAPDRSS